MRKIRLHFSGAHSISFLCFTRQIPLLVTCYCCVGHIKCLFNSKILFVIFNINMILNTYGKPPETNLWYFFKMLFVLCTLSVFSCYSYSNGNYSLMSITCWRFTKGSFEAKLSVFSFFFLFCFLFCFVFVFVLNATCSPVDPSCESSSLGREEDFFSASRIRTCSRTLLALAPGSADGPSEGTT